MTKDEIGAIVREELYRIAPDIDFAEIEADGDLREEFDLDSIDFLNLVTALNGRLGLEMPEADYPKMASYDALVTYLDGAGV